MCRMLRLFPYPLREVFAGWRIKKAGKLALPIIGGMSSQTVVNLVDTAMVGRLGVADIAAVGITSIALWALVSPLQGISPAVQTITARRLGEKATHRLHEAIVASLYFIILSAIPLVLILGHFIPKMVPFFTSDPDVVRIGIGYMMIRLFGIPLVGMNFAFRGFFNGLHKPSLYLQTLLIVHSTNIVLNYLLIFGKFGFPRLESRGAALASLIAICLGTLNYMRLLIKHRPPKFSFHPRLITKELLKNIARLAIPMSIMGVFLSTGYLVFYRIAAMMGTAELAATNIIVNLMLACFLPAMGMGLATISLVSKSIGEKNYDDAKKWSYTSGFLAGGVLTCIGISFALFPRFWMQLFIHDPAVIEIAIVPLVALGITQFYDSWGIIWMHSLMGAGANKQVMKYTIAIQWGLFLPAAFICAKFFNGNLGTIWILMAVYRFLLLLAFRRGFLQEKWMLLKPI